MSIERERIGNEDIDWEEIDGGRFGIRPIAIIQYGSVFSFIAIWFLDRYIRGARVSLIDREVPLGVTEFHLQLAPNNVDYLMGLTLLGMFWWVIVPLISNPELTTTYWREFKRNRAAVVSLGFLAVILVLGLIGPVIIGRPETDFAAMHRPPVGLGGTWEYPLGTNSRGEGIFKIVLVGMRVSMQVGLIATAIIIVLASVVGTIAAFSGGWIDEVLMRFVDLLMTFPTFFLILFLVYVYGGDLFLIILILGITGWGGVCRLVRSEALQRTEEEYIDAALAAAASRWYIIRYHLIPNVSNTVITAATLAIPFLILTEAVLAFLGFGDPDVWSWGRIIARGRDHIRSAWWVATIPGVFLFLTILAFNFLGDALRDAIDPRHEAK